jgi:hypothetical protein
VVDLETNMRADTATHEAYQESEYGMEEPFEDPDHIQEPHVSPQRAWATIVMIIGTVVFLLSLVVLAGHMTDGPLHDLFAFWSFTTWVWVFFGILAVLLVVILILLATTPARQEEGWYDEEDETDEALVEDTTPFAEPAEPGAADTISLRCPKCMNIFSLQDPGQRPFHHECPHCEVRGIYSGP